MFGLTVDNAAADVSAGGTFTVQNTLHNTGTIDNTGILNAGILDNLGIVTNTGTLNASDLDNLGTINNAGTLTLAGASSSISTVIEATRAGR